MLDVNQGVTSVERANYCFLSICFAHGHREGRPDGLGLDWTGWMGPTRLPVPTMTIHRDTAVFFACICGAGAVVVLYLTVAHGQEEFLVCYRPYLPHIHLATFTLRRHTRSQPPRPYLSQCKEMQVLFALTASFLRHYLKTHYETRR